MKTTLQTIIDCWLASSRYHSVNSPATEGGILSIEEKIGNRLPTPLRELYQFCNGGWIFNLDIFPLEPNTSKELGLTNANEMYRQWGWQIPQEILLFAGMGGEEVFGIWLPETRREIFRHPIIEIGEITDDASCMGVAGTNLVSFLLGWTTYHLMQAERDELCAVEEGGEKETSQMLKQLRTVLDMLQVPQSLRNDHFDEDQFDDSKFPVGTDHHFAQLRKWADPLLPDPYGDSYSQTYTVTDLKKLFGDIGVVSSVLL